MIRAQSNFWRKAIMIVVAGMLTVCAGLLLTPQQAHSADNYTIANPRVKNASDLLNINSDWDLVTFGTYTSNSSGTKKPVLWRVLSLDGNTALLLSEYTLYSPVKYNETSTSVTWQDCTLRKFLNGLGSTYASNNFLYNAFSSKERDLLVAIDGDKVTIPTQRDVINADYGFCIYNQLEGRNYTSSSTRYAMPSDKGNAGAILRENYVKWWLRYKADTDAKTSDMNAVVAGEVWLSNGSYGVASSNIYARPMIRVKLDSSIKYAGHIHVDGEDATGPGKRLTYYFLRTPQSISNMNSVKVTVKSTAAYTGKQIKPKVTVTFNGKTLKKGTDYTVSYGKNISVGTGKVVVKSTGKHFDTVTKTFSIVPKTPAIKSLKALSKGFQISVAKQASGTIAGYQVNYRVKGASKWTSKKFKTTKALSKSIKSLTKSKTYQVHVCTYKASGKTMLYSSWSKTKTVKTK